MKIYKSGEIFPKSKCVLALGSFEALHIAHISLIKKAAKLAKQYGISCGVYLFDERVENVVFPGNTYKKIYSNEQRFELIAECGIDFVYSEKFDKKFMNMSAENFVYMLKEKLDIECAVVGYNYTFGKNRSGNAQFLAQLGDKIGFKTEIIDSVMMDKIPVSSSRIRDMIEKGDIKNVSRLLGREYTLSGIVVHERGVGRKMHFPTANIIIDENIMLPKNGVYATYTKIGEQIYPCVTNIGTRPTFDLDKVSVETYIIDFASEIYGKTLKVYFCDRLRDEKKFSSQDELREQIFSDVNSSKEIFEKILK